MTRKLTIPLILGLLVALMAGVAWAQGGTGELTGLMTDPQGAVVPNAEVKLANTATGDVRTTVTTAGGVYHFAALPIVGTYTLTTSPKGFKKVEIKNIVLSVGTIINQDIKLVVGAASEEVTVEASVQLVQTQESSLSDLVDRRVWQSMPLETRSQNEFIGLLPGQRRIPRTRPDAALRSMVRAPAPATSWWKVSTITIRAWAAAARW